MLYFTFAEMAESVTPETLQDFLERLRTRPEPQSMEYSGLILLMAAETLRMSPFELFVEYQGDGEKLLELGEWIWRKSYPREFNLKTKKMGILINFPVDRLSRTAGVIQ